MHSFGRNMLRETHTKFEVNQDNVFKSRKCLINFANLLMNKCIKLPPPIDQICYYSEQTFRINCLTTNEGV